MFKKYTIILILLLFTTLLIPQSSASEFINTVNNQAIRLWTFNTTVTIDYDSGDLPTGPVSLNNSFIVDIETKFKYEITQMFPGLVNGFLNIWGNQILFRDENQNMSLNVSLSVDSSKDWCSAELQDSKLEFVGIGQEFVSANSKLIINISENAPALDISDVNLQVKFTPEEDWGLIASENQTSFSILSEYLGTIDANFGDEFEGLNQSILIPDKFNLIPINITNNGNGESQININVDYENDEIWNISIEQESIIIPADEMRKVFLNITPPADDRSFSVKPVLTISSQSTSEDDLLDSYKSGITIELNDFEFIKENTEEKESSWIYLFLIMTIILIIIVIIGLFIKKR